MYVTTGGVSTVWYSTVGCVAEVQLELNPVTDMSLRFSSSQTSDKHACTERVNLAVIMNICQDGVPLTPPYRLYSVLPVIIMFLYRGEHGYIQRKVRTYTYILYLTNGSDRIWTGAGQGLLER